MEYLEGNIYDYLRDKFLQTLHIPVKVILVIDTLANLSGFTLLQMLLAKFGLQYLLNYLFWISLIF